MKHRVVLGVVVLGTLTLSQASMAKAVVIQYWGSWGGVEKAIIEEFNKKNAGRIQVKASEGDAEQRVLTAVAGGAAPDCFKLDRFRIGSWAARDVLTEMGPYLKKDKINESIFFKAAWNEAIYAGKCWGIPWNTDSRGLYYNKTIFRQTGLDPAHPPKTWDDLSLASRKIDQSDSSGVLTRAGFVPTNGNWGYTGWLFAAGGDITTNNDKKVAWNSPAGLKAANYVADTLAKYGGIGKIGKAGDFWSGRAGMEMMGSWGLANWITIKNKKFELGAAAPPRPVGLEKDPITWAGGYAICIPRGAKHPKEAWEFIKYFCTSKDSQIPLGRQWGQIPVVKDAAYDDRIVSLEPLMKTFIDLLAEARFRPVIPAGDELQKLYEQTVSSQISAGVMSPAVILEKTATEAQKVLDRAWAKVRRK